jgi:hypothetical protein
MVLSETRGLSLFRVVRGGIGSVRWPGAKQARRASLIRLILGLRSYGIWLLLCPHPSKHFVLYLRRLDLWALPYCPLNIREPLTLINGESKPIPEAAEFVRGRNAE